MLRKAKMVPWDAVVKARARGSRASLMGRAASLTRLLARMMLATPRAKLAQKKGPIPMKNNKGQIPMVAVEMVVATPVQGLAVPMANNAEGIPMPVKEGMEGARLMMVLPLAVIPEMANGMVEWLKTKNPELDSDFSQAILAWLSQVKSDCQAMELRAELGRGMPETGGGGSTTHLN